MALCIEKLSHDCGSSDGLQVFQEDKDGAYTGYCFSCGTYVPAPYSNGHAAPAKPKIKKSAEQIAQELEAIASLPTVALPQRKLRLDALEYFNVKVALDETDGHTPTVRYFPYTIDGSVVGFKAKLCADKKMWWHGTAKAVDLFGWQQAIETGARRLYITEGEEDAIALYQALRAYNQKPQYQHYHPAVVSLINGAGSVDRDIGRFVQKITRNFPEVVLVFDRDEAGRKATDIAKRLLPSVSTVELPEVDANACVIEGKERSLASICLFKQQAAKNTRIINANTLFDAASEAPTFGLDWPWEGMTALTRGLRTGETTYIGAGVKMGKSEVVNTLAAHFITRYDKPVFMAKPEEGNKKTVKLVAGKIAGKFFHDPTKEFDRDAYHEATNRIGDRLRLLNLYAHVDWNTLRQDILAAVRDGAKAVFIDPITNLTNGVSSGEANTVLQGISQDLSAIALDEDLYMFIFCHLKAPDSGPPHERGGEIFSNQFAGSRAMMRSCNYMIGLEGDKNPTLPAEQRNTRSLVMLEDREFGETGKVDLYWDQKTGLFNEVK